MYRSRAVRKQRQAVQEAERSSLLAPVNGWNARDPLANQKPGDAYQLDNWIPRAGYVEIRKGFAAHITGFSVVPESFLPYLAGDAELSFAVSDGDIYDVTSSGALGSSVYSGLTNNRLQSINVSNDAGVFMLAFNGADDPIIFDGSSFTVNTITGTAGSTVFFVNSD